MRRYLHSKSRTATQLRRECRSKGFRDVLDDEKGGGEISG
jgi:hypothetical protein